MKILLTIVTGATLWILTVASPAYCGLSITNVEFDPPSPAWLIVNEEVFITFDYQSDQPTGIYIYTTPFTDGVPTPGNVAAGSPLYQDASGSGSSSFKITYGEVLVDSVRFQIYSSNHSLLLYQTFVPVMFFYAPHTVTDVVCYPPSPAVLGFGMPVDIIFTYWTVEPTGVRIFVRPFTDGQLTPWCETHNSPVYPPGTGAALGCFTILHDEVTVDSIRFQMRTADMSRLLMQKFCPVRYVYTAGLDAADPEEVEGFPANNLLQNFSNPFCANTTIAYSLKRAGFVNITVYNILGQKVRSLVDDSRPAGLHEVQWDGKDDGGERVSHGVYFYKLVSGDFSASKKMILLK